MREFYRLRNPLGVHAGPPIPMLLQVRKCEPELTLADDVLTPKRLQLECMYVYAQIGAKSKQK